MDITGLGAVADLAKNIIGHFWPDKTEQEKAQLQLTLQQLVADSTLAKGQLDVNAAEANAAAGKLGNVGAFFVAGWRPAVGWACALTFAWSYVISPLLVFVLAIFGKHVALPALDLSAMMPVLLGMLGLGGMRTAEKIKGLNPGA